jgi:NAD(P)-dependent dehydrogenase (short-subunit alcohol dehydrogenase family)
MANYLIISGTSAIGRETAQQLVAEGHHVFLTGRNLEKIQELSEQLRASYGLLDATDFEQTERIFLEAKEKLGSLEGVVNCAGSLLLKPAHLTTKDEYEAVIAANLTTSFAIVRAAGKVMAESGGSIVLISSAAALEGLANHEAIASSKAALTGLILSAAATYAPSHLRFNAVAPGLVETSLTQHLTETSSARKVSEAMHPLGRIGSPRDIAAGIVFFLKPENDWVTGQVLAIDGGLSRIKPRLKVSL